MTIYLHYQSEDPTILYAASELELHLCSANPAFIFIHNPSAASGSTVHPFHIQLAVDVKHASDLDDSYQIDLEASGGSILGSNSRSVLLAVYALLRRCGFRFLLPGKTFTPEALSLHALYMKISHTASLRHRGVCIEGADSLENVLDFIDWLPKLGFNSFFLQFKEPYIFLERWYHHTMNDTLPKTELSETFLQYCYQQMYRAMEKRSLLLHMFGHGWTCEAIGLPSRGWIPTTEQPAKEQEKLLAMIGGKRTYVDAIPMNTNLCYADQEAVRLFCDSVVTYIEEHPAVSYLHIWLADEVNHICECDECRKTTPTDQYLRILNLIDQRLTEKQLTCKLVFLLYQELMYPPTTEVFHNPDRFTLMFAPISRTFRESYPDKITQVTLPDYRRNHMILPVTIEENLTYLAKWQEIFHGDSMVYDYPLGRAHYGDLGYVSISRVLAGDIAHVQALGLNGYISCQELRAFLPNGLPNYVMGYMADNTDNCFDALAGEYYHAAYGEHYKEVWTYLSEVSALSNCDYFNSIGARTDKKVCAQYQSLLNHFEAHADMIRTYRDEIDGMSGINRELQVFFWKLLDYHLTYGVLLTKALIALSGGDPSGANRLFEDFRQYISEHEEQAQQYLDVYRIIEVSTKYTGFLRTP